MAYKSTATSKTCYTFFLRAAERRGKERTGELNCKEEVDGQ